LRVSYLVILGLIISFSLGANFSFAQTHHEPGLTIRTNNASYDLGDTVTILGTVTTVNEEIDIIIQLWKDGDMINVKQMQPDVNGDYSYTLLAEGPKWTEGAYVFRATYGQGIAAETIFSLRHLESFEQSESTESSITVQMNGPSTFYLDVPHQIIRATVEFQDYHPSDGFTFMKVTYLPTNIVLKDFEIYPKPSGNDMWAVQVAYPILESDIKIGGQALLGEYEIHIRSEYGSQTGSTKFSILESQDDSEPISETEPATEEKPGLSIPSWVKDVAEFWCEDEIVDGAFVKGIQYLIDNDIIVVPVTSVSGYGSQEVPQWVKNNACWWAQGLITDEDFAAGIEYLVREGIIIV